MKPLELSPGTVALIAIGIFLIIMAYSAIELKPQLDKPEFTIREEGIVKVTKLKINPGESYSYVFRAENASANISYAILDGGVCTIVKHVESNAFVCIDEFGNDPSGLNSTYPVPAIIPFKPWMLAVEEGWRWNISSYMVFDSIENHIADTEYSVVRKEYYKGREAWVVRISTSDGEWAWDWIDAEKRILLREISTGYEVELVKGLKME